MNLEQAVWAFIVASVLFDVTLLSRLRRVERDADTLIKHVANLQWRVDSTDRE